MTKQKKQAAYNCIAPCADSPAKLRPCDAPRLYELAIERKCLLAVKQILKEQNPAAYQALSAHAKERALVAESHQRQAIMGEDYQAVAHDIANRIGLDPEEDADAWHELESEPSEVCECLFCQWFYWEQSGRPSFTPPFNPTIPEDFPYRTKPADPDRERFGI